MKPNHNTINNILTTILLLCCIHNVYIYYKDVKEIKQLEKEKLRLEIEKLKKGQ